MQLLHRHTPTDAQRLDEIIRDYTPRVRRICPELDDAVLMPLIERMAQRQLANERTRVGFGGLPRGRMRTQRRLRQTDTVHLRAVS